MQQKIWVVVGQQGEYSDYHEWIVASYTSKEAANLHAKMATKEFAELQGGYRDADDPTDPTMAFDPLGDINWGSYEVKYEVVETLLTDHPDLWLDLMPEEVAAHKRAVEAEIEKRRLVMEKQQRDRLLAAKNEVRRVIREMRGTKTGKTRFKTK